MFHLVVTAAFENVTEPNKVGVDISVRVFNRIAYAGLRGQMQNLRRRTEQDVEKAYKYGQERFATELLSVIDNLERALESDLRQAIVFAERVELWTLIWMVSSGVLAMVLLLVGFRLERRSALAEVAELENERLRVAQEESELLARELNHRVKNPGL